MDGLVLMSVLLLVLTTPGRSWVAGGQRLTSGEGDVIQLLLFESAHDERERVDAGLEAVENEIAALIAGGLPDAAGSGMGGGDRDGGYGETGWIFDRAHDRSCRELGAGRGGGENGEQKRA